MHNKFLKEKTEFARSEYKRQHICVTLFHKLKNISNLELILISDIFKLFLENCETWFLGQNFA